MGEVYQATDSQLGRSVAIKLLAPAFASDPIVCLVSGVKRNYLRH
jgi:hypothetical protein